VFERKEERQMPDEFLSHTKQARTRAAAAAARRTSMVAGVNIISFGSSYRWLTTKQPHRPSYPTLWRACDHWRPRRRICRRVVSISKSREIFFEERKQQNLLGFGYVTFGNIASNFLANMSIDFN
jgi:hypothetical protein